MTFVHHNSRREHSTLVQKQGGDAAVFEKVDGMHESETDMLCASDKGLMRNSAQVAFRTDIIMAGDDALAHIRRCHPLLEHDPDAYVNIGQMDISNLPYNFML